jgi:hypothetical protein
MPSTSIEARAIAPVVKTDDVDESSSDFDFGTSSDGDGGDGAASLNFSAFDRRHKSRFYPYFVKFVKVCTNSNEIR